MAIISAAYKYKMFKAGDRVVAAVSGGPDSAAMLHALHTRSEELGITLHVAHLNHGIRGEESNLDEAYVRNLAQAYGLQCIVGRADVPAEKKALREGEEEAARTVRYKFLADTAANIDASKIAVGHNKDDRAESVLMNIFRGSGIDGLGSIRPVRGMIVRPLIDTNRADIESYIKEHGLGYRTDTTNQDTTYTRNRVRHELLPLLERDYNPQVKNALVRLAEMACDYSDFVRQAGVSALRHSAQSNGVDAELMTDMPPALRDQILRAEILRHNGDLKDVTFEQVQRVVEALKTGEDFSISLPSGRIWATTEGNLLRIGPRPRRPDTGRFEAAVRVPGTTTISQIKLRVQASIVEDPTARKTSKNELLVDAAAIKGELRVRSIEPGDRIAPFGMNGTKKLQDVLVDGKIPQEERGAVALVVDDEKVLWVIGVLSSESIRVTDKTRRAVYLSAAFEESWKLD